MEIFLKKGLDKQITKQPRRANQGSGRPRKLEAECCIETPRYKMRAFIRILDAKANINPAVEQLKKAVGAKSRTKFVVAFDNLTSACNTFHAGADKPFIRIQRPTSSPLSNQNFAPGK